MKKALAAILFCSFSLFILISCTRAIKVDHGPEETVEERGPDEPAALAVDGKGAYLRGIKALERGDPRAAEFFERALVLTDIKDHVRINLARAHVLKGELRPALALYSSVVEDTDSALLPAALYERALLYERVYGPLPALGELEYFIKSRAGDRRIPAAILETARLFRDLAMPERALGAARSVFVNYPASPEAERAAALIIGLKKAGLQVSPLLPEESARKGMALLRAGRPADAAKDLLLAIKAGNRREDVFMAAAESLLRTRRARAAAALLEKFLLRKDISAFSRKRALFLTATAAVRLAREDLLNTALGELRRRFPRSAERAKVIFIAGRFYEGRGAKNRAFRAYREALKAFKTGRFREMALWRVGWLEYRLGRFKEAVRTFDAARGPLDPRLRYWKGRALERLGRMGPAIEVYSGICGDVPGYYCLMARRRLGRLCPECLAGASLEAVEPDGAGPFEDGPEERHYRAAMLLLEMGLTEEAAREFSLYERKGPVDPRALVRVTGLLYRAGDYHDAIAIYERNRAVLKGPDGLYFSLTYPLALVEELRRRGYARRTDPFLVAAVMREESTFNPGLVSGAGAVGIMQVMPGTARFIAGKAGLDGVERHDLLDRTTNIRLGTAYLSYLKTRFRGNVVYMIAGYNAGPEAVTKWRERLPEEMDEFIESIPYPETRRYTKKVMRSFYIFRSLARSIRMATEQTVARSVRTGFHDRR